MVLYNVGSGPSFSASVPLAVRGPAKNTLGNPNRPMYLGEHGQNNTFNQSFFHSNHHHV
jgi:hypothetical protein